MDETFQHPSIQLFIMGPKPASECVENSGQVTPGKVDGVETSGEDRISEENVAVEKGPDFVKEKVEPIPPNANLSDWEARRYGAMAARILRDVKLT